MTLPLSVFARRRGIPAALLGVVFALGQGASAGAQTPAPSATPTPKPAPPKAGSGAAAPAKPGAAPGLFDVVKDAPPTAAPAKAAPATAVAAPANPKLARDIYRELCELNTTDSVGDTLVAARAMAARLLAAGFPEKDVRIFETAPKRGNLVARLRGTGKQKPLLLLAHTDVVEAKREDWTTDPFKFVEKDGYFYARGSGDDKFMAATFVYNLIRYQQEGFKPDRDIILALTTDEEISDKHHYGINWLIEHQRPLIEAEFALNEGGGVGFKEGKPIWNSLQTTEKLYQTFTLEVKNSGGHSSQPRPDNAIYDLARGLGRLSDFEFPLQLNATTRLYFERMASIEKGQLADDFKSILSDKPDPSAVQRLSLLPPYNAQLRTTCVATQLQAGHAENALPQLAQATVNCRIIPGTSPDEIQKTLTRVLADAKISVKPERRDVPSKPSAMNPKLVSAVERLTQKFWPGITLLPTMSAGATDSRFLRNAGIAAYGHSGLGNDIFDVRAHGKDERVSVKAFSTGQQYQYELVKLLSGGSVE